MARQKSSQLEQWEIALVKALLRDTDKNDQTILAYFTRPDRSINHRVISHIRREMIHTSVEAASKSELNAFLQNWPFIDPSTGLHLFGDELLIKAREAMLNAVQNYNNPKAYFRSETFIVTAIIAWTYLLHACLKEKGVEYRSFNANGSIRTTKHGADCYLSLSECLDKDEAQIDWATKKNLEYLIEVRNEIAHRCTQSIDAAISAKLQACCTNFNSYMKQHFDEYFGLEDELSFALQFSHLSLDQQKQMTLEDQLPDNIAAAQNHIEEGMTDEQYNDPRYAVRVAIVARASNNKNTADHLVTLIPADSHEAEQVNNILLKRVEPKKFRPSDVVRVMQEEGFLGFRQHEHTKLKNSFQPQHDQKDEDAGGKYGIWIGKQWFYYQTWIDKINRHCEEHGLYKDPKSSDS